MFPDLRKIGVAYYGRQIMLGRKQEAETHAERERERERGERREGRGGSEGSEKTDRLSIRVFSLQITSQASI
jgi:hypothetical protein